MAITPIGQALDRATPGFDTLVQALQNTATRIQSNREFARQVQAREDFALFQSDLQFENQRRALTELVDDEIARASRMNDLQFNLHKKTSEFDYGQSLDLARDQADVDIDTATRMIGVEEEHTRRVGGIQSQQALDQARDMIPIQAEAETARMEAQQPFTIENRNAEHAQALERLRVQHTAQGNRTSGSSSGSNLDYHKELQTRFPSAFNRESRSVQANVVDIDSGTAYFNINGEPSLMSLGEYDSVYMPTANRLESRIQVYEELLRSEQLTEFDMEDGLGIEGLKDRIARLRSSQNDLVAVQENEEGEPIAVANVTQAEQLLDEFSQDERLATVTNRQAASLNAMAQAFPDLRTLSISEVTRRGETVYRSFGELLQQADEEENKGMSDGLRGLRASWELWADRPRHVVGSLYINWEYDPMRAPSLHNPPFITETQLKQKTIQAEKSVTGDIGVQNRIDYFEIAPDPTR